LKRAREEGTYARRYVAIASRAPIPDRGAWDAPIGRAKNPRHRAVGGRDATNAQTLFATIATTKAGALLAVSPITGRTHQIRVHVSHAGAPLLGDRAYEGPARVTLPNGRVLEVRRIALHAARVAVPNASGEGLLTVEAPVPPELCDLWTALGGDTKAWDIAVECVLEEKRRSS
jgi:23S rRNA-/tRNA-specific pseudouridylate synthase